LGQFPLAPRGASLFFFTFTCVDSPLRLNWRGGISLLTTAYSFGKVMSMLIIRLQRVGRKNDPTFRIIVTDSHKGPKSGNYIELLGSYNPKTKTRSINSERVKYWQSVGAQLSATMYNLLISDGILKGKKVNVLPKKSPILKEAAQVTSEAKEEPLSDGVKETVAVAEESSNIEGEGDTIATK
jgi:small subunit ribosomal protein S16